VLKHGAVPTGCPHVGGHCEGAVTRGDVQQLDLGASGVAFVWNVQTPGVIGTGTGWELRVDKLRGGRSTNYVGGACGADLPVTPTMADHEVVFDELTYDENCGAAVSQAVRGVLGGRRGTVPTGPGDRLAARARWPAAYELRGPTPPRRSNRAESPSSRRPRRPAVRHGRAGRRA